MHHKFVKDLSQNNFQELYSFLTPSTLENVRLYRLKTREIISTIRAKYPGSQALKSLADLTIHFGETAFTVEDFELATSDSALFVSFCEKRFTEKATTLKLLALGTSVSEIQEFSKDTLLVRTTMDENVIYIRSSGGWKTNAIFYLLFAELRQLAEANLEVTKRNVSVFSD